MENTLEATSVSSDTPLKVVVVNTDDFREDLVNKLVAAIAVTTVTVLTKVAIETVNDKRKARKKAKEAKKLHLHQENNEK